LPVDLAVDALLIDIEYIGDNSKFKKYDLIYDQIEFVR
jgi:hypothetical protein